MTADSVLIYEYHYPHSHPNPDLAQLQQYGKVKAVSYSCAVDQRRFVVCLYV